MNYFFLGDTHFRHANIIKYCNRPFLKEGDLDDNGKWISKEIKFQRCKEMNEKLIENWNSNIKPKDIVYHVGDFGWFDDKQTLEEFVSRLNGKIELCLGNHDKVWFRETTCFKSVGNPYQGKMVKINNQKIFLFHYACRVWDCSHHGSWHCFGHSHGFLASVPTFSYDVGVDNNEYKPISFEQLTEIMKAK